MNETQELISQFHKTSIELVKIHLNEFRSKLYVDVRTYVLKDPAKPGSAVPIPKGINISADLLPKLIEGLNETARILKGKEHGNKSPEKEKQEP